MRAQSLASARLLIRDFARFSGRRGAVALLYVLLGALVESVRSRELVTEHWRGFELSSVDRPEQR